ncbi:hypothetical protein C8J56DRAFT_769342 [Mycena floridula]|nr:hypothetical protein C8J56DRAFT_769342 [Mycena floridula]
MPIPPQSRLAWASALTAAHTIGIATILYRVSHRYNQRKLWLDDYFVVFALLIDLLYVGSLWGRYHYGLGEPISGMPMPPSLYWLSVLCFFCVVWTSRISMALSIARIFPPRVTPRRIAEGMAILFGAMWFTLTIQTIVICTNDTTWHNTVIAQCTSSNKSNVAWITVLTADVIADACLVITPLTLLWRVKLPKNTRRLVLSIFCASVGTCAVSIVVHVLLLGPKRWGPWKGLLVIVMCHIEASICLLVCNLLVVVTIYFRVFRNDDLDEVITVDERQPPPLVINFSGTTAHRTSVVLTTIDPSMFPSFSTQNPTEEDENGDEDEAGEDDNSQHGKKSLP